MERVREIEVKVYRYDSINNMAEERLDIYRVPIVEGGTSVLNVLQYISENFDGGLGYYFSCRRGECAGCAITVNGKPRLACLEIVEGDLVLEPVGKGRVLKDLLTIPVQTEQDESKRKDGGSE